MSPAEHWALPIPTPKASPSLRQCLSLLDWCVPQVVPLTHPGTQGSVVWMTGQAALSLAWGRGVLWGRAPAGR